MPTCVLYLLDHANYQPTEYLWFEQYGDVKEELPHNMPIPKGNAVRLSAFFDANHASCLVTRRLTSGVLLFMNNVPIKFYSKRQSTLESSTFGSETVAG